MAFITNFIGDIIFYGVMYLLGIYFLYLLARVSAWIVRKVQ